MKLHSSFILGFLFLAYLTRTDLQPDFAIEQDDSEHSLTATHTDITLKKKSFSISFNCKPYTDTEFHAARIGMFLDKAALDKIRDGMRTSDIEFFSLGTGYATSGPYDPFFIFSEDAGHHYVSYKKDGDKRAELVSENDRGILRLRCNVKHLSIDGEVFNIEEAKIDELHLVLFWDMNLNTILEPGEYKTVSINFN
jgi:hypothetical protein